MNFSIRKYIVNKNILKYFDNTIWVVSDKLIRMTIGVVVAIAMGRYLGPAKYGELNYVLAYVGLFATVASLGLNDIIISEIVKFPEDKNLIKGTSFLLIFIASIFTILSISFSFLLSNNDYITNTYIFIFSLSILIQPFYVIDYYFQSKVLSKYSIRAQFFSLLIISGLKLFFIYIGASLKYFIIVALLEAVLIALGLTIVYFSTGNKFSNWKFQSTLGKSMIKRSWPIILASVSIAIYMRIDQVMLKNILGFEAVGNFSVAVKLTELWYFVPMSIASSFFPALIRAKILMKYYINQDF